MGTNKVPLFTHRVILLVIYIMKLSSLFTQCFDSIECPLVPTYFLSIHKVCCAFVLRWCLWLWRSVLGLWRRRVSRIRESIVYLATAGRSMPCSMNWTRYVARLPIPTLMWVTDRLFLMTGNTYFYLLSPVYWCPHFRCFDTVGCWYSESVTFAKVYTLLSAIMVENGSI